MALVSTDWSIERDTGDIRYTGDDHDGATPSYATVIEFHRWLQDKADDAVASGVEELDITNVDPSRRSTDNIITLINNYNISGMEAEHLYDGSVIYNDGDDIYDGVVNFGNSDVQIQIIQNGAVLADDWWNYNSAGLNADSTSGISHRFMVKTRHAGTDIDGRKLIGTCRRWSYTYSEFNINSTARGNNVLALTDSSDLNNATASGVINGYGGVGGSDINNSEGYVGIDVDNNTTNEYYYSEWNRGNHSINDLYEYAKLITMDGTSESLYGLSGELFRGITHQVTITPGTGTWVEPESLSWGTGVTVGTGQLLAVDNTTGASTSIMWLQLLTGVAPNSNLITGNGGATGTADVVTDRSSTISKPFCGASTGSAIIGSYGFGIEVADLTSSDKVTDLYANVITPPNYVQNTVGGLTATGDVDRVLVAPWNGSATDVNGDPAIDKGQMLLSTALTTDNIVSVVVKDGTEIAIPSDTPSSGIIRVTDNNDFERRLHYSGYTGTTFTIDTTDGNEDFNTVNANIDNYVYITYLDKDATAATEAYTAVQTGSRDLVVIVRNGGSAPVKQFISEWTHTSSAQTISAIKATDV